MAGVMSVPVGSGGGGALWDAVGVRIASVEVIPYALPFREPYVTARGRLERREMVLLRLRSDDGLIGLGEAVPLSLRAGRRWPRSLRSWSGSASATRSTRRR